MLKILATLNYQKTTATVSLTEVSVLWLYNDQKAVAIICRLDWTNGLAHINVKINKHQLEDLPQKFCKPLTYKCIL